MKKILLYFPFILIIHLNAQTPCNEWVSSFGGSTSDIGWLIARDDLGNVYISGEYTSPVIYFGNDTIFNNGNMDAYILKINPDGIPQWCFTVGGSNEDRPRGLCTDLEGNIISAGRFYSPTLTIGDSVFINHGGSDIYLFKLNSDGEVIWARSFGSDGTIEFGFQVDVDSENNIVMTGYYNGYSITFDNYILTNYEEGYDDMLVVKFDSSGNVLWARDAGGDNDDRGLRLTIDQSDNIYVSGHFGSSTMYMEPFSLVNTGSHDIFLAKYDSNGDEKWLKGVQGSGPDYPYDVAIDNFGSVYTTGYFESPFIKFDSHIIYNNGYIDLFLAKYDSLGNNVWARSFGGSGTDKAYDIDVDSLNNLYAIGYFTSSSISLDTITLYTNGMADILTMKFNSDGEILAAKSYGGTQDDYGAGVVVFGEDELAITGYFKSSVIEFDTLTLNNQGYEDAFVYCINQLYPQAQFTYIIGGDTVTFQNTSLNADSYLWDFGDGNTSDEINPVHQYNESGYYDVTLVANNTCGSDTLIQTIYIMPQTNVQTPCNEWVSSFGGSTSDIGWLIARDDLGNVYISGEYTSPVIYFGNDTIFNNGNMDAYILKINPDGIPQWSFTVGGSNEDRPRGLCTDLEGNIISAGRFYSPTLTIGDSVFINQGGSDIYLFKLNSDGEVIWARSFGSDGTIEFGFQVDVDSENNIVMTGYYNGYSISFDSYILTNYEEGYDDMLVVKFDSSGNVLWARDGGGNNDDRGYRLTIDQSDNIYVSGHFGSSIMYMGPFSLINTGSHDIFLAKYDSNGDEKWLKGVEGSGPDYPYDVAIDNFGSVYTTGYFESPFIKFDSHIIYNNGYIDLFLAKYDSLGNNVWARSFGGSGTDKAYDIDVDSLNNLYAIGYFTSSSISLDTITLYTNGMADILTMKFNSDGEILAAKSYGGTQDDYGAGVVVFGEDELAITGYFKSSVIEFDTLTLNNQGYEDAFVYCINQLYPQAQFTYIIDGDTVTFQNTSLNADSYLWDFGDGNTSDEINPVHQYNESGYYDVTLVANNSCGSDSLTQAVYICDFPVSDFSYMIDSFTVVFENLSFYADSYIWDFGDGYISTLENPVHTYELEGEYTVTLISINTCGSDTRSDIITICIQPVANFDQLINGLQVRFINLSQNADSYQWDFGDNCISDEINPVHIYQDEGIYLVTLQAYSNAGCYSEISQQITVDSAIISHVISIPNGWSGISSYVVPLDDLIAHIFEPIVSEMDILMDGFGKVYWPDQGINTIYLWDSHHGYKIKTTNDLQLIIDGKIENNRTLNLFSGWNIIPVLSLQPVDCQELFEPLGDTLTIVKEIAGTNLYWPSQNIYTLTALLPGKAYLLQVNNNCTLTFPDIRTTIGQVNSFINLNISQPWNDVIKTGSSHIIAIDQKAMNELQYGDIIGCFTESEACAGLIRIEDVTINVAITVFGDDPTTFDMAEGFKEKEPFHFRLYRESNDEIYDLNVQYDGNLPDRNVFKDNGLSAINGMELLISEYNDNSCPGSVLIYPNPGIDLITILNTTGFDNIYIEISNLQGQILYQDVLFNLKERINISSFEKGIYLIKIDTPLSSITKKIVKY